MGSLWIEILQRVEIKGYDARSAMKETFIRAALELAGDVSNWSNIFPNN